MPRREKSNRKVELAPRGVGDPFVDMNGGTEAFGFGRSGIRHASPAMASTAWEPQAPPTRCPSGSSPTEIACQTKRSGVNPRAPRPVKRAPGTGAVIATPERRDPFPSAPGEAFLIPCAKDRYRSRDPASRFRDLLGSVRAAHRAWSAWRTRPPRKSERASGAHPTPACCISTIAHNIRSPNPTIQMLQPKDARLPMQEPSLDPNVADTAPSESGRVRVRARCRDSRKGSCSRVPVLVLTRQAVDAALKAVSSQAIPRRGPCRKRQAGLHSAARPRTSGRSVRACIQPTRSRSALARS